MRALAERRAVVVGSHTPASSAQNLLSTCVGYPGRSYPRGRESAPVSPSRPRNADGRGAGTEDRTRGGSQSRGHDLRLSSHPNEASISRKTETNHLTMFVPCVRISQCSAP